MTCSNTEQEWRSDDILNRWNFKMSIPICSHIIVFSGTVLTYCFLIFLNNYCNCCLRSKNRIRIGIENKYNEEYNEDTPKIVSLHFSSDWLVGWLVGWSIVVVCHTQQSVRYKLNNYIWQLFLVKLAWYCIISIITMWSWYYTSPVTTQQNKQIVPERVWQLWSFGIGVWWFQENTNTFFIHQFAYVALLL